MSGMTELSLRALDGRSGRSLYSRITSQNSSHSTFNSLHRAPLYPSPSAARSFHPLTIHCLSVTFPLPFLVVPTRSLPD